MPSTLTRRPVPALVALLALLLLTGLVWWRVLNRDSGSTSSAKSCPTPTKSTGPALTTLPAPSTITVQVLNSTDRAGIAAQARTALVGIGFLSPAVAGNDAAQYHNKIAAVAQIRYGASVAKAAKTLSFYLPGAQLVPTSSKSTTVVVSLGTHYKAVSSATAASAAMTREHVQVGSGTPTPGASSPSC